MTGGNGDSDHGYSIAPVPLNPVVAQGECGVTSTPSRAYSANMVRIIGGRPTQPGRWPWQVAVLNRFKVILSKWLNRGLMIIV